MSAQRSRFCHGRARCLASGRRLQTPVSRPLAELSASLAIDVLSTQQNPKQLFADFSSFPDLISPVSPEPNYKLLNLRRMTSAKRVAHAANWQVIVERTRTTQPVWFDVIRLP